MAAYNRQGMGPFSIPVELLVDSDLLVFLNPGLASGVPHVPESAVAPGLDLVVQEVWFVGIVSLLVVAMVCAFLAVVCIRRRNREVKTMMGHYNGNYAHLQVIKIVGMIS